MVGYTALIAEYFETTCIGQNDCIKICTEIRSDYHPLLDKGNGSITENLSIWG